MTLSIQLLMDYWAKTLQNNVYRLVQVVEGRVEKYLQKMGLV